MDDGMDRDGKRVKTKIENRIKLVRKSRNMFTLDHMVCVAHICTEITFSLQLSVSVIRSVQLRVFSPLALWSRYISVGSALTSAINPNKAA